MFLSNSATHPMGATVGIRCPRRRAFTLTELLIAGSSMGILVTALAAGIVVSSQALPSRTSSASEIVVAGQCADQVAGDLFAATAFSERQATSVTFTVPDRNKDSVDEQIRYYWSGTTGGPLTRSLNGSSPEPIVDGVQDFGLLYTTRTIVKSTQQTIDVNNDNVQLAYFNGWSGIVASPLGYAVSSSAWICEYFTITPPAGASNFKITKVQVKLKAGSAAASSTFTVGVHKGVGGGSYLPQTTPIGTPVSKRTSDLTASYVLTDFDFTDVTLNTTDTQYVIVVKGSATDTCKVQYLNATTAPADSTNCSWTSNSGGAWSPAAVDRNKYDMPFYVFGSYKTSTTQTTDQNRYFVTTVQVRLRVGANFATRADTTTQVINAPEVPTP